MQRRHALCDDQREMNKGCFAGKVGGAGSRLFIEAVMWIAKTGAP